MREGITSRVTVADWPYGDDFYSVSLENFGYHFVHHLLTGVCNSEVTLELIIYVLLL